MILKSVKAKNFGIFRELELEFPERGMFLVTGMNNESGYATMNGIGKTTFMDAIPFCLWGKTVRDDKVTRLRAIDCLRDGEKEAMVEVKFLSSSLGEVTVTRIENDWNNPDANHDELNLNVSANGKRYKAEESKFFLNNILGTTFSAFRESCLIGQTVVNQFSTASPKEKEAMMKRLFRIDLLDSLIRVAREDGFNATRRLLEAENGLREMLRPIRAEEARLLSIKAVSGMAAEEAERIIAENRGRLLSKEIAAIEIRLKEESFNFERLSKELEFLRTDAEKWRNTERLVTEAGRCVNCEQAVPAWLSDRNQRIIDSYSVAKEQYGKKSFELDKVRWKIDNLKNEAEKIRQELEVENKRYLEAQAVLRSCSVDLAALESALADKRAAYEKEKVVADGIREEKQRFDRLEKFLGSESLRRFVFGLYAPFIDAFSNRCLSFLTNGDYGVNFRFGFAEDAIKIDLLTPRGSQNFFRFSGGERQRIDGSIFLAFNRLAHRISRNPFNLVLIDEMFGIVDSEGRKRFVELLRDVLRDSLVLIISNHDDLQDLIDDKIMIERSGGESKIRMEVA